MHSLTTAFYFCVKFVLFQKINKNYSQTFTNGSFDSHFVFTCASLQWILCNTPKQSSECRSDSSQSLQISLVTTRTNLLTVTNTSNSYIERIIRWHMQLTAKNKLPFTSQKVCIFSKKDQPYMDVVSHFVILEKHYNQCHSYAMIDMNGPFKSKKDNKFLG